MSEKVAVPLQCSNCQTTVRVSIQRGITGNLVIVCPRCGHRHYRFVEDGVITENRWASQVDNFIPPQFYSVTATVDTMTWTSTGSATYFLREAWYNSLGG
ncbi:MAG: hypothetical protein ACTSYX_04880 [Candidatus Thorarchaeota archaeon]